MRTRGKCRTRFIGKPSLVGKPQRSPPAARLCEPEFKARVIFDGTRYRRTVMVQEARKEIEQ